MSNPTSDHILNKAAGLVDRKKPLEAQKQLASGIKLHPNNYELLVAYARIAEQLGQWSNAVERWKRLRQKFPNEVSGYISGIGALLALNKTAEVAQLIGEGLEKFSADIWFVDVCARAEAKNAEFDKALTLYRSMQKLHPKHPRAYTGETEILIAAERYDEANVVFPGYLSDFPDDLWLSHSFAILAMRQGKWSAALDRWNKLLAKFPEHEPAKRLRDQVSIHIKSTQTNV